MALLDISSDDYEKLDHGRHRFVVLVAAAICMVFATIAVSLRIYSRWVIINKLWVDDYFAVKSWAGIIALGIIQTLDTQGLGTPITGDMHSGSGANALTSWRKDFWITLLIYNITLLLIKLTFLFQLHRTIRKIRRLRISHFVVMLPVITWAISQIFTVSLLCIPIQNFWGKSDQFQQDQTQTKCSHSSRLVWINAIGNIVANVVILILALSLFWGLTLVRVQNRALVGIFTLGFFTCVLSAVRLVFLFYNIDLTYALVAVPAWNIAELTSGTVCAALMTLQPLLGRFFPAFAQSSIQLESSKHYNPHESGPNHGFLHNAQSFTFSSGSKSTTMQSSRDTGGGAPPPPTTPNYLNTEFFFESKRRQPVEMRQKQQKQPQPRQPQPLYRASSSSPIPRLTMPFSGYNFAFARSNSSTPNTRGRRTKSLTRGDRTSRVLTKRPSTSGNDRPLLRARGSSAQPPAERPSLEIRVERAWSVHNQRI